MKSVLLRLLVAVALPIPQLASFAYWGHFLWSPMAWVLQVVSILMAVLAIATDALLQGPSRSFEVDEIKSILCDVFLLFGAAAGTILALSRY